MERYLTKKHKGIRSKKLQVQIFRQPSGWECTVLQKNSYCDSKSDFRGSKKPMVLSVYR